MKTQKIREASIVIDLDLIKPFTRGQGRFTRQEIAERGDEIIALIKRHVDCNVPYLQIYTDEICSECGAEWSDDGSECRESCQDGAVRRAAQ